MVKTTIVMIGLIFSLIGFSAEGQKSVLQPQFEPKWPNEKGLTFDKERCNIHKNDLAKFPVTMPEGMILTSVCHYSKRPEDQFLGGHFYFDGDATILGKLILERREGEEGGGDYLMFSGKSLSTRSMFSSAIYDLTINTVEQNSPTINYPKLSDRNNCWSADAVLRIKSLKVVWSEQDDAGNFPLKFEIVKIAKFSKCVLR